MKNFISTFFKCSITAAAFISPAVLVASVSYPSSLAVVNFDGSSTIQPFIQYLFTASSGTSSTITPPKHININIQASGTSTGINKLMKRKTDFALSSKDTDDVYKNPHFQPDWTSRQFKTLTIAQDAIVILYQPPKGCTSELALDKDKFKTIYSLFTGHKFPDKTNSYSSLLDNNTDSQCQKPIIPHSRAGGANKSGTAYSFIYSNPLFKEIDSEISSGSDASQKGWLKKVKSSIAGTDFKAGDDDGIRFTAETSSLAFDSFIKGLNDEKHGSMVYLSASFVLANWDKIEAKGLKIAKYKKDSSAEVAITKDNWQTVLSDGTYGWVRNINLVYAIYQLTENQRTVINHIVANNSKLNALYVVPITFTDSTSSSNSGSSSTGGATITKTYPKDQVFIYNKDCNFNGWTKSTCPAAPKS